MVILFGVAMIVGINSAGISETRQEFNTMEDCWKAIGQIQVSIPEKVEVFRSNNGVTLKYNVFGQRNVQREYACIAK